MKKIKMPLAILSVLVILFLVYSCSKDNELDTTMNPSAKTSPILEKFLRSATFQRTKNTISAYGEIEKNSITIDSTIVGTNTVFHHFTVVIKKGSKINATLDVVDLKNTKNLPYGDNYALNLNDMSEFNTGTKSGKISLFDLNYDNFRHTVFTIKNNTITNRIYRRPSVEYLSKFISIRIDKSKAVENLTTITYGKKAIPCDSDGNGNLGYFECYSCFKSASEMPGTFGDWWCDVPVAGWASCWATMSSACLILSSIY